MLGHFCNVSEQRVGDARPPKSGTENVNMFSKNKVAFVFWKFPHNHDKGRGPATKSEEFSEKFQMSCDHPPSFSENYVAISL